MTLRIASVLTLLLLGGIVAWSATGTTPSYTLTDLGPGIGYAVNDSGVVVGVTYHAGGYPRATLWSPATQQATDLGIFDSLATGINADGVVVGYSSSGGVRRAFRWEDGVATDLGTLPGFTGSAATGVNASGQIVGSCYDQGGLSRAFLWENGVMTDLGTLGGWSSSAAAINDAGTVVGWSEANGWTQHAFAWDAAGGMRDLGAAGYEHSAAAGIDASGHAVGLSFSFYGSYEGYGVTGTATLFDGGAAIALPGPESDAYGVRDATADHGVQVVGANYNYWDPGSPYSAFLWEVDSAGQVTAHDLNDLLDAPFSGELMGATAINAAGRIVALGYASFVVGTPQHAGTPWHVFVLTPSTLPPVRQALHSPAYFTAVAGSERVSLSWSAVSGADGYVVQRGAAPGGPYQTIATGLTQTMYSDTSAPLGSTYYYVVAGVEGTMVGSPSAEAAAAPLPYPPTNLAAKAGKLRSKDRVDLRWTASASNNVAHYKVYRSGNYLVATLGRATSYTVTGLARRTTYSFWVTAVHAGGQESLASNVATVVTSR
jgi:probable HAF family extracellular repeat protein